MSKGQSVSSLGGSTHDSTRAAGKGGSASSSAPLNIPQTNDEVGSPSNGEEERLGETHGKYYVLVEPQNSESTNPEMVYIILQYLSKDSYFRSSEQVSNKNHCKPRIFSKTLTGDLKK